MPDNVSVTVTVVTIKNRSGKYSGKMFFDEHFM